MTLPENEVIGVKRYDLGGQVVYAPPLYLIEVFNRDTTNTLFKMLEVAGLGATLGTGALAGLGVRATVVARVLLFCDRAAVAVGAVALVINDHRGWILSRFEREGSEFLRIIDIVQSAVAIYGFARIAVAASTLIGALRSTYSSWKAAAASGEAGFSSSESSAVAKLSASTEEILNNAGEIQASVTQSTGRSIFGKKAPTPTGRESPILRQMYLSELESEWFRTKLSAYAKLTGKGEVDWDALTKMVQSAEFREYASLREALQSGGFAGVDRTGRLTFAMGRPIRQIPIIGRSSIHHELVHVFQEISGKALTSEAWGQLSFWRSLRLELAANLFGSPALFVAESGVVVVITSTVIYTFAGVQ